MSNWYKPHLKSVYNAQDKTFVSRLNRLRFFHDRRVLKFLRWKKGDLGRRLRGIHSLRWYKLRYRFGLKFYNFSSKKRRKLRVFRQNNLYKVGLDRKKNFLSFYRKFDESKIKIWFKEYYNKSRQYKVLNFFRLFETRLDVLCFRMKLLPTIFLSNMFIKNTGILVNYHLIKEPGTRVSIGDLISFENSLQWNFFSSRFTEQLWKRWHRFKELNLQRKKTRLLVFREYYKKNLNIQNLDKKSLNTNLFSTLENNWTFFLDNKINNNITPTLVNHSKRVFNNTFWFLNSISFSKRRNLITTKYFNLLTALSRSNNKLPFSKSKLLNLLLIEYLNKNSSLSNNKSYSFNSLIFFYKNYFHPFTKKSKQNWGKTENKAAYENFLLYLKISSSKLKYDKKFIKLSAIYFTGPFLLKKKENAGTKDTFLPQTRLNLFKDYNLNHTKNFSLLKSDNKLFNSFTENSLKTKMNFWLKNLLPFLRFNFNLKNLIEVLFIQFFSVKSSFSFFFLKFWLNYRKISLNFSKIFVPLSKLFNYIKLMKILVNSTTKETLSYTWFWKSFYSRFFVQKMNTLIHFKNSFVVSSKSLINFFHVLKAFLNPSIYLKNQNSLKDSLYKSFLILNSTTFDGHSFYEGINFESKEGSYLLFTKLFSTSFLSKMFHKVYKEKESRLQFNGFFEKYNSKGKNSIHSKKIKSLFLDQLNYLYFSIAKAFHESFLLENFLNDNSIDHTNTFFKQKNINFSQKQFVSLALSNSINVLKSDYPLSSTLSKEVDTFFFFNKRSGIKKDFLEYKGFLNHHISINTKSKLVKSPFIAGKKQSNLNHKYKPFRWLQGIDKQIINVMLTRNAKKLHINQRLLKSLNSRFLSKSILNKKIKTRLRKHSILKNFKRYRKPWKSRFWNHTQSSTLKEEILTKNSQKKFNRFLVEDTNSYKPLYLFTKNRKFSDLRNVTSRFYTRKVLQKLSASSFFSKNWSLLNFNYEEAYVLSKSYKKKANKYALIYPSQNSGMGNVLAKFNYFKELLKVLKVKVNFTLKSSNKNSHLLFLKSQITSLKNSMVHYIIKAKNLKLKSFNFTKFFVKTRKISRLIKGLLNSNIRRDKKLYFLESLYLINRKIDELSRVIEVLSGTLRETSRILYKKKNSDKRFWLKFRLKIKRISNRNLFKRQAFNKSFAKNKKEENFKNGDENKIIFLKSLLDKPFRKTQNFVKRSRKRRKNYKLGQKQSNSRWLRKQKKRFCDINLTKWQKLQDVKRPNNVFFKNFRYERGNFNSKVWSQYENTMLKDSFFNELQKKFLNVSFFEKFFLLESNTHNLLKILVDSKGPKNSFIVRNLKIREENQKRNSLYFKDLLTKNSKQLDFIKIRGNRKNSIDSNFLDPYKKSSIFLFKINTLRRYKDLVQYHQRWNRNSTVRLKYKMRSKLLKLNKIRRLRKKKFFNIRNKPLLLLPTFLEFDFVTFRSFVISTPNLEASLYGGATNSYFYSFLSFYQRLGL